MFALCWWIAFQGLQLWIPAWQNQIYPQQSQVFWLFHREMLRSLSGSSYKNRLQKYSPRPSYGNYLWRMVHWFPFSVVIKYSKQGIRDIMEVQTDPSNDSMTVRSMPVCVREKLQSRLFRSVIRSYSSAIIKSCVNWANLFWSCFISLITCHSKVAILMC